MIVAVCRNVEVRVIGLGEDVGSLPPSCSYWSAQLLLLYIHQPHLVAVLLSSKPTPSFLVQVVFTLSWILLVVNSKVGT